MAYQVFRPTPQVMERFAHQPDYCFSHLLNINENVVWPHGMRPTVGVGTPPFIVGL